MTATASRLIRASGDAKPSCLRVERSTCLACRPFASSGAVVGDDAHADDVPKSARARRWWGARGRGVGELACRSRTRSSARVVRSRWPSASTCADRGRIAGRDIHWWMEAAGVLDERYDEVDDIVRARRVPSMQLAGSPERATFDLNALTELGVRLVGKFAGISGTHAQFSGSLRNKCELADLKLGRLLDTIDEWALASGDRRRGARLRTASRRRRCPNRRRLDLDLAGGEIRTIIWATGFRPDYSWLDVDVLDAQVDGPPRRRCRGRCARHVRDRHAVPAPTQIQLHRRRVRRRPRPRAPLGGVPRRSRLADEMTRTGGDGVAGGATDVECDRGLG